MPKEVATVASAKASSTILSELDGLALIEWSILMPDVSLEAIQNALHQIHARLWALEGGRDYNRDMAFGNPSSDAKKKFIAALCQYEVYPIFKRADKLLAMEWDEANQDFLRKMAEDADGLVRYLAKKKLSQVDGKTFAEISIYQPPLTHDEKMANVAANWDDASLNDKLDAIAHAYVSNIGKSAFPASSVLYKAKNDPDSIVRAAAIDALSPPPSPPVDDLNEVRRTDCPAGLVQYHEHCTLYWNPDTKDYELEPHPDVKYSVWQ